MVDCSPYGVSDEGAVGRMKPDLSFETILIIHAACEGNAVVISHPPSEDTRLWNLDVVSGTALLTVISRAYDVLSGQTSDRLQEVFRLSGLPTMFDVVASFAPGGTVFSWNVPVMPDGFPSQADTFDVLSGDLVSLPDLTQAARIDCTVPAGRAPVAGEHLSTVDSQPDPAAGSGRYYLVATQLGGEERTGRQRIRGDLTGRPVIGLPGCP